MSLESSSSCRLSLLCFVHIQIGLDAQIRTKWQNLIFQVYLSPRYKALYPCVEKHAHMLTRFALTWLPEL